MQNSGKHTFAIFFSGTLPSVGSTLHIKNSEILHRVRRVLRIKLGEKFTLFNKKEHAIVKLSEIIPRCTVEVKEKFTNSILKPEISVILPLLKQDDLEEAVKILIPYGVNNIQLVVTEKTHRSTLSSHEKKRLERIMISSCQESKYYTGASLFDPISLQEAISFYQNKNIYQIVCDIDGKPLLSVLNSLKKDKEMLFLIGPEADFSLEEKKMIFKAGFVSCSLSSTVLRAWQAAGLVVGAARLKTQSEN